MGDNAYESDSLDAELARRGVELIGVRYERVAENFLGMLHLACGLILRGFMRWSLIGSRRFCFVVSA
jgi:hypothetical protein